MGEAWEARKSVTGRDTTQEGTQHTAEVVSRYNLDGPGESTF